MLLTGALTPAHTYQRALETVGVQASSYTVRCVGSSQLFPCVSIILAVLGVLFPFHLKKFHLEVGTTDFSCGELVCDMGNLGQPGEKGGYRPLLES